MEKKWSRLDTFLSIVASIATISSIILGYLFTSAKNATVQIDQPNGPIEVKLVDFPDVYGDLKAENERLKAELKQKENQAGQANVTENVQTPAATIPQSGGTYLFSFVPKKLEYWNVIMDSDAPYAVVGDAQEGWIFCGEADYTLNGKYRVLKGSIAPSDDIKGDWNFSFVIYADGSTIYSSPKINRDSGQVDFTCSVAGTTKLELRTDGGPLILREFILS